MSPRARLISILACLAIIALIPLGRTVLYTVNERELAVILQFGEPIVSRTQPGLYLKIPLIQEVRRLPKTLQVWHGTESQDKLVDVPTADGKKVEATVWAAWRITDPQRFVQTLRTIENAESRVKEFVRSTARDILTSNPLSEVIRSTDRQMTYSLGLPEVVVGPTDEVPGFVVPPEAKERIQRGRLRIMDQIKREAQSALAADGQDSSQSRGIELVDVGLSRIEFVPQVREAAFNRAIALMDAIAIKATSEGEQRKREIINLAQADAERIRGEGSQEANMTRGRADAQIMEAYARAIRESGEFYGFIRTLEVYKKAFQGDTRLILTTDSPLLRFFKGLGASEPTGNILTTGSPAAEPLLSTPTP